MPKYNQIYKEKKRALRKTKEYKQVVRERQKIRNQEDEQFRMKRRLRARLYQVLKSQSIPRYQTTMELLGCSISEFKEYIELKFLPDMTWANYGEWHIDHIYPCSLFDLTKPSQQQKCFHYSNMQPLWAKDNFAKGNRLIV